MKNTFFTMMVLLCFTTLAGAKGTVKITGKIPGLVNAQVLIYDEVTKEKLADEVVKNNILDIDVDVDPKDCRKLIFYIPKIDDGKRVGTKRVFFADSPVVKLTGRIRGNTIARFKMINSSTYTNYKECLDKVDETDVIAKRDKLDEIEMKQKTCGNSIERDKLKPLMFAYQDAAISAEIESYKDLLAQLKKGVHNPGLNARIYESYYPFKSSIIATAVEKYIEVMGEDYMKSHYWTNQLLTRYQIVSAYIPGTPAQNVVTKDLDWKDVNLLSFKGKALYINVWDFDKHESTEQLEYFNELAKKHKNKDIVFINLCRSTDVERWKFMCKQYTNEYVVNLNFDDQGQDMNGVHYHKKTKYIYKTKELPRAILIGKDHKIVRFRAPLPSNEKKIKKVLKEVL